MRGPAAGAPTPAAMSFYDDPLPGSCRLTLNFAPFQTAHPRAVWSMVERYPSSGWCKRCASRDCSVHSSMNPGEAFWENRPPDSANVASCAS